MKLNCKPGDLAMHTGQGDFPQHAGKIYFVLRPYDGYVYCMYGPAWWVEYHGRRAHCLDAVLRPIRDPGEDATDEMIVLLGKPETVEVV